MTYLELMEKTLKFIKKEEFDPSYYDFWYCGDPKQIKKNQKHLAGLGLMYLTMKELQSNGMMINDAILSKIEEELTIYEANVTNTIISATTAASEEFASDADSLEVLSKIDSEDTSEEEKEELIAKLYESFVEKTAEKVAQNIQIDVAEYPINHLIRNTVIALPELLFTQTGQEYLPKGYNVGGQGLNIKCNRLLRNQLAIHKMEEENCYLNGYNSLYYSIKAASTILNLARKGNYSGLRKLDAIDDSISIVESDRMERSMYRARNLDIKSTLEIVYQSKDKSEFDLKDQALLPEGLYQDKTDEFMDFILSDPTINEIFSTRDIALILLNYYDPKEEKPKSSLQESMPSIKRILESTSSLYQKRRQLSHLAEKKSTGPQFVKK